MEFGHSQWNDSELHFPFPSAAYQSNKCLAGLEMSCMSCMEIIFICLAREWSSNVLHVLHINQTNILHVLQGKMSNVLQGNDLQMSCMGMLFKCHARLQISCMSSNVLHGNYLRCVALHTEKYFRNLIESNRNKIIITLFRLISVWFN